MTTLVRLIVAVKVLFWIGVITLAIVYSAEIGGFFTGALDRADHLIGYEENG